jgi:alanine racemase
VTWQLTPVLHHFFDWDRLLAWKGLSRTFGVHLQIDTGMGRLGFRREQWPEIWRRLMNKPPFHIEALMTHWACADDPLHPLNNTQKSTWEDFMSQWSAHQLPVLPWHANNSAGFMQDWMPESRWVRPGLALYGISPLPDSDSGSDSLRPVMQVFSQIIALKDMPVGSSVSYGATYTTSRESRIAVVAMGYADGIPLRSGDQAHVLIRGQPCPVRGRITMDMTLVDVSHLEEVQVGDEVVILGASGNHVLTADAWAKWAQTISYEILCGMSPRVPRIYRE